jgi:hypothetical protein
VLLKVDINDPVMKIVEQIADLFGETKYSISLFGQGKKLNISSKIANLNIGYTNYDKVPPI